MQTSPLTDPVAANMSGIHRSTSNILQGLLQSQYEAILLQYGILFILQP